MSDPVGQEPKRPSGDLPPGTRLLAAIFVLVMIVVFVVASMHESDDSQDSCRIGAASHGSGCISTHAWTVRNT